MHQPARHLLSLTLVALHTLAILIGPCAHEWAGFKHRTGVSVVATADAEPVDGGPAATLSPADDPGDSCFICQFSIQGQLAAEHRGLERGDAVCSLCVAVAPPACILVASLPSRPRAPPLLADSLPFAA